jgi:hypothetical protein
VSRTLLDERALLIAIPGEEILPRAPEKMFAGANQQARIAGMFALSPRL